MRTRVSQSVAVLPQDNFIINGNFDFWQRGVSQEASGYGSADRWVAQILGSDTAVLSRQAFDLGQTEVPGNPEYFMRAEVVTGNGSSDMTDIIQKIEGVKTLSGKKGILSFWARADASRSMAIEFHQYFGTGGSPSSINTGLGVTLKPLTTSWQKITVPIDVPSVSEKTLGEDGNSYLAVRFIFEAGSSWTAIAGALGNQSGTFDIAQVKLEEGQVATPFIARPIQQELALCQRYYEKSYPTTQYPGQTVYPGAQCILTSTGAYGYIPYGRQWRVIKRAAPTVAIYSVDSGAAGYVYRADGTQGDVSAWVADIGDSGYGRIVISEVVADTRYYWQETADAEL